MLRNILPAFKVKHFFQNSECYSLVNKPHSWFTVYELNCTLVHYSLGTQDSIGNYSKNYKKPVIKDRGFGQDIFTRHPVARVTCRFSPPSISCTGKSIFGENAYDK